MRFAGDRIDNVVGVAGKIDEHLLPSMWVWRIDGRRRLYQTSKLVQNQVSPTPSRLAARTLPKVACASRCGDEAPSRQKLLEPLIAPRRYREIFGNGWTSCPDGGCPLVRPVAPPETTIVAGSKTRQRIRLPPDLPACG